MQKTLLDKDREIYKYTLENDYLRIDILNYGGIIQKIFCPDVNQKWDNVVLGYEDFEGYIENPFYLGCIAGRVAGRTESFTINGVEYPLPKNTPHHLHGGFQGLDKRVWTEEAFTNDTLVLSYTSPHMEEGYPAELHIKLKYMLIRHSLYWSIQAISDRDTAFNPTNHSYFDLSGGANLGTEQFLQIKSDYIMELDDTMMPTGRLLSVEGTPFDFRESKKISRDIEFPHPQLKLADGYDHPFIIDNHEPIVLKDEVSRRKLSIATNQHACVFYSGNFLKDPFTRRAAICLETQAPSNGINIPEYRDLVLLKAKTPYIQENVWTFSTY